MVLYPAAVNVSNSTANAEQSNNNLRGKPGEQVHGLKFRQEVNPNYKRLGDFRNSDSDTLYSIKVAGYGPQQHEKNRRDQDGYGYPSRIYGDYWDASLKVFSLATF